MGELEEKKQKLGIKGMDYHEQKGLYNEFVDAGGKVVPLQGDGKSKINMKLEEWIQRKEEEQKRELAAEERRRQEEAARKAAAERAERAKKEAARQSKEARKTAASQPPKEELTLQIAKKMAKKKEKSPMQDYFSRLAARIVCILYGIQTLFGLRFTRSFLDTIYLDLQNMMMEAKRILTSILYQDKAVSLEIRSRLAQTGFPYYYELLFRLDQLYDDEFFTIVKILPSEKDPVLKAKPHFLKVFRKILMLNRYQPSLFNAIDKALFHERMIRSLDETTVTQNSRRLQKYFQYLFFNFYPKLTNLVDFYYKNEIAGGRKVPFRDFLGISDQDTIGSLTRQWQEEEERERRQREEEERRRQEEQAKMARQSAEEGEAGPRSEEEIQAILSSLPDPVRDGIVMVRQNISFRDVLQYYAEKKDPRMIFPMNDKVFLAYSLIEFFDKEFSFLFVSVNVQYNVFTDRGARRDTRSALKDLYFKIDDVIYKRLNEYLKILVEIRKVNTNTYMLAKEQYARLQQLGLQRSQISRNIRVQCGQLIDNFVSQLKIIVDDYDGEKRILQNPDETVTFDVRILGQRLSQNQKIITVFRNAYLYASALRYLIMTGELSGSTSTLSHPVFLKIEVSETAPEEDDADSFEV